MTSKVEIGSVSQGTMRAEDLAPVFLDELERLGGVGATALRQEYDAADWCQTSMDEFVHELFDKLDEHAPEYCYFGAHPGDGADYEFWPCEDFESMMYDNDVEIVDDLAKVEPRPVAVINDHGNVSFGHVDASGFKAVWEIV